ncbi:MAG: 30S ribosomal protein S17e [Candidatus Aenigmarchaeota archaeon]|nr:30S ribosomal protein S17e [Candidatus Aenigmarchaeota archaeon]
MGRIKTKEIKRMARQLVEKYTERFSDDFEKNKSVLSELEIFESKKMRNKVAGHIVRLAKNRS